jgi:stearoyl-CoA desaturase (delta-9 desaturase)
MEKKSLIETFKEAPLLCYLVVVLQAFGICALYNIFSGNAPSYWWIGTIIGFILLKMLGIDAGYHRLFSHRSFTVGKWMKYFILWCGILAGQGSPIFWVTSHRGYHHRYSDTDNDPHSPKHGFWHSYILWIFKIKEGDMTMKSIPDLMRDPIMIFAHRHFFKIFILSHLLFSLISVNFWLYTLAFPAFITLHVFCCQTSMAHYSKLGYKNYETKDNSTNVPWLWPLMQGDCWHNNHHRDPKNPNYGGRHWWELDPTYWLIKLIRRS